MWCLTLQKESHLNSVDLLTAVLMSPRKGGLSARGNTTLPAGVQVRSCSAGASFEQGHFAGCQRAGRLRQLVKKLGEAGRDRQGQQGRTDHRRAREEGSAGRTGS